MNPFTHKTTIMKKLFFIIPALALLAAVSCKKQNVILPVKTQDKYSMSWDGGGLNTQDLSRGGNGNNRVNHHTLRLAPGTPRGVYYDLDDTYPHTDTLIVTLNADNSIDWTSYRIRPNPDGTTNVKYWWIFKQADINSSTTTSEGFGNYGPLCTYSFPTQTGHLLAANIVNGTAYDEVRIKINSSDCADENTGSEIAFVKYQ